MHASFGDMVVAGLFVFLLVMPVPSAIGAWLLERRMRRLGAPAFRRFFGLAAFCGGVLITLAGAFAAALLVPHDFIGHIRLLNLSYFAVTSATYLFCAAAFALLVLSIAGVITKWRVHQQT